jgi:hypothetical protein
MATTVCSIQFCQAVAFKRAYPHHLSLLQKRSNLYIMDTHIRATASLNQPIYLLSCSHYAFTMPWLNYGYLCQRTLINMPDLANRLLQNVTRGRHDPIRLVLLNTGCSERRLIEPWLYSRHFHAKALSHLPRKMLPRGRNCWHTLFTSIVSY